MRQSFNVLAYLDPATGSMLLQILLGAAAAVALFWRSLWQRISGLFPSKKAEKEIARSESTRSESTSE